MTEERFNDIGRMKAIRRLYEGTPFKPFRNSSFKVSGETLITTCSRLFTEGIDFDLIYFPLKHLGYKFVTAVTGELYAALAKPETLCITLGISAKLDFGHISELWSGIVAAAAEHGYSDVSLDLCPSPNGLTAGISASGTTSPAMENKRSAAASKDLICVSGSLGAAFLGMQVLEREKRNFSESADDSRQPELEKYRMLVGSYLKPELSPYIVSRLEETGIIPSHGYLVSKGLSDAVKRLVRDSGLGAKIYADRIPFEGNSFALGQELNIDPVSAAMNGGDDFRLLFTVPILEAEKFRRDFQTFDIIGHLAQPEVGAVLVTPDGVELPMKAQGWPDDN